MTISRFSIEKLGFLRRFAFCLAQAVGICILVMIVAGVWGWYAYGTPYAIPAILRGDVFLIDSNSKCVGKIVAGTKSPVCFAITNLRSHSVTILGVTSTCGCVTFETLPMTIEANGRATLNFSITPRVKDVGKSFSQRMLLQLDTRGPPIVLTIAAEVVAP